MPTATRRSLPKRDRRRALELLASCRDGCTEAMMLKVAGVTAISFGLFDGANRARSSRAPKKYI
jgi:hypothetical protein